MSLNGPGQYHLIILGRKTIGAGRLLWVDPADEDGLSPRHWHVDDLTSGHRRLLPEWDIGRELTEMEVLAWSAAGPPDEGR